MLICQRTGVPKQSLWAPVDRRPVGEWAEQRSRLPFWEVTWSCSRLSFNWPESAFRQTLRLSFSRPSSGFFAVAAIPAARSFAIRLMSFTGTGLVSGNGPSPFAAHSP